MLFTVDLLLEHSLEETGMENRARAARKTVGATLINGRPFIRSVHVSGPGTSSIDLADGLTNARVLFLKATAPVKMTLGTFEFTGSFLFMELEEGAFEIGLENESFSVVRVDLIALGT